MPLGISWLLTGSHQRSPGSFYGTVCSAAVVLLASSVGRATIVEPRDLGELVREAKYVGSVWIEQSTSLSDDPNLKYPACGSSYRARTVDVVKGTPGRVSFYALEELVVGREYLVLLAQGLGSATEIISTTSLSGTSPGGKGKYIEDCAKRYPGLWSTEGSAAPLLDRRLKIESEGHSGDRWVWRPYFLRDIGAVGQLDEDTLRMVLLSAGPAPYPAGTYLSWQAVRNTLLQALRAMPHKGPQGNRAK